MYLIIYMVSYFTPPAHDNQYAITDPILVFKKPVFKAINSTYIRILLDNKLL